jgi:hypothetical protein
MIFYGYEDVRVLQLFTFRCQRLCNNIKIGSSEF